MLWRNYEIKRVTRTPAVIAMSTANLITQKAKRQGELDNGMIHILGGWIWTSADFMSLLRMASNLKRMIWNLPDGPVVKNSPYNAGDDQGSILGRGTETPRAAEQPSLRAATSELVRATARKSVHRSERS